MKPFKLFLLVMAGAFVITADGGQAVGPDVCGGRNRQRTAATFH